jgi:hypothetical protein
MMKLVNWLANLFESGIRDLLRPRIDPDLVPSVRDIEMLRTLARAEGLSGLPDSIS